MNPQQLGAHELMEIHEVLTDTIDGINQFQLYAPHCQDQELKTIIQNQIGFMTNEYNTMLQQISSKTGDTNMTKYRAPTQTSPIYGMQSRTSAEAPNQDATQINDRDIASGMLGCAKSSATIRMHGALECTDPQLRNMMTQGAKNCADQAYEIWLYMNKNGYYLVPTFPAMTMQQMMNQYSPSNQANPPQM